MTKTAPRRTTGRRASGPPRVSSVDEWVKDLVRVRPAMAVPHFLIACFMYYVEDQPILSDHTFDHVLIPVIRGLPPGSHRHQHLITAEHLEAGTGFDIKFPPIVQGSAAQLRARFSAAH